MKHRVTVSARLPLSTVEQIDILIQSGKYRNLASSIEALVTLGLQLEQYQEMIKDPKRHAEFVKKMKSMMHNGQFDKVVKAMTPAELDGAALMIEIEKNGKYLQRNLI